MTADRRTGWRGLGIFWAAILLFGGAGALALEIIGPPPHLMVRPAPQAQSPQAQAPQASPPAAPERIAAPDPALLEPSHDFPLAMLPRVAPNGRMARVVYARPFDMSDKRPRIGLIVTGIGTVDADSRSAIDTLPGAVTLAFSPYVSNPEPLEALDRAHGHEMLLSIPMEPQGYPLNDAGSRSLLTGADPAANQQDLEWALGRIQGYVGATGAFDGLRGERFADQTSLMAPVLQELGKRGLLYVDARPGSAAAPLQGLPNRDVDLVVDDPPQRAEIEAKLAALERLAKVRGYALGLAGPPRAVTVERIAAWAKGLDDRGIALAPLTALLGSAPK